MMSLLKFLVWSESEPADEPDDDNDDDVDVVTEDDYGSESGPDSPTVDYPSG